MTNEIQCPACGAKCSKRGELYTCKICGYRFSKIDDEEGDDESEDKIATATKPVNIGEDRENDDDNHVDRKQCPACGARLRHARTGWKFCGNRRCKIYLDITTIGTFGKASGGMTDS